MTDFSREDVKSQLRQMNPYEFEKLVAEIWKLQDYEVTVRNASADRGVDVEAIKGTPFEQKVLIQAKRYAMENKVGSEEVRNYATLYQQVPDADTVVIVATSDFTTQAKRLAKDLNVKAVNGDQISELILKYKSELKIGNNNNRSLDSRSENSIEHSPFESSKSWKRVNSNQTHFELCPECSSKSVWFGELNGNRHLKCESCNAEWRKEEKSKGIIFTHTITGWRQIRGPNEGAFMSKSDWVQ